MTVFEKLSGMVNWNELLTCNCQACQMKNYGRVKYVPICEVCGDKRCDKALDHEQVCEAQPGRQTRILKS